MHVGLFSHGSASGEKKNQGANIAEYAFYNEFGATIHMPPQTRILHFRPRKKGSKQLLFSKANNKKNVKSLAVTIPGRVINIPPRPFMRLTAKRYRSEWVHELAKLIKNGATPKEALTIIGEVAVKHVVATIESSVPPPNRPSTVASKRRRGKSQPDKTLIDTGEMEKNIQYEVVKT